MDAMEISLSGLDVEWKRLEIIAQNLANVNTTRTGDGHAYLPLRLVSGPGETFEQVLGEQKVQGQALGGVAVYGIEPTDSAARRVYEPNHPHAEVDGFVSYPGVNHSEEMTLMIKTARAYEANLVAMAAAQQIYSSALQIGRQS
jgi:flagellar basal-body rod protein FlgC